MLTFTPDGTRVLVANEGEPNDAYTVDPEGSVSVVDLVAGPGGATVATARFTPFDAQKAALIASGVRIYGPDTTGAEPDGIAPVSRDLEPEYITCDGATAWVTLQEANALAIVDIATATVTSVVPLGTKDHLLARNSLDPSDRDGPGGGGAVQFVNGPVRGMYLPDAIRSFTVRGRTFLVTANEGDTRDWGGYSEEERIKDLVLDPVAFPNAAALQQNASFGRLKATSAQGDVDDDGQFEELYSFGARSFTLWKASGELVWDSGDDLERMTAAALPLRFNADNTENDFDARSDDKGPEPEGIEVGLVDGNWYVFVALERVGGIVVYDVTNPKAPRFQAYVNLRDFRATPPGSSGPVGPPGTEVPGLDLGPESLRFVPAEDSPNGKPMLIVVHEVSGSTTFLQLTKLFE
jgi:hypothetical protein